MKAFIISQFSYCPLVSMFHSRNAKNRVSKIHETALRLVYDDRPYLSFIELLIKNKSVSIHQRNLQLLATDIFKVKNGVSTGLTEDNFHFVNKPYHLRNNRILFRKRNRTVFYGTESLSSLAPRIWELIPQSLKDETQLSQLKLKLKHGLPANVHAGCVKNILVMLISFKLFIRIDFTILFNPCVLYLFNRCF